MKRLYFLFLVVVNCSICSETTRPERRGSIIELFLRRKSASNPDLTAPSPIKPRKRTHSTEEVAVTLEKLKIQLHFQDAAPERPLTLDVDVIDAKYQRAKALVEHAHKEKDKKKKQQLLHEAEVLLEAPRIAGHEPSLVLLLEEIFTPDFNHRSSAQLNSLERRLLSICAGHPDLLAHYNRLRIARCEKMLDAARFEQAKSTLIGLVRLREKNGFSRVQAQKYLNYLDELDARREFVASYQLAHDALDVTADAG
jgi:hypothetical protein